MKWQKKGLIYAPNPKLDWQQSFAMLPCLYLVNNEVLRIFYGSCDKNNIGRISYIDVNPSNPKDIIYTHEEPCFYEGQNGCFDDNGVVPVSLIEKNGKLLLYYIGFQLGVKVPYYMFCGLAESSNQGKSFKRILNTPILDRTSEELYARCGCHVIKHDNKYKMWYIGSYEEGWTQTKEGLKPLYNMKYIESDDGVNFNSKPITCMHYNNDDEHGFGRPYVWIQDGIYKMIMSIRTYSQGYQLAYAESNDGINWKRLDNKILQGKQYEWDCNNQSYATIFNFKDKTYLFYNGNDCGKTGFGYAELVK